MVARDRELAVRAQLALEADLIGPFVPPDQSFGGEEILPLAVSRWYSTGLLAPQGARAREVDGQDSQVGGLASDNDTQAEGAGDAEPETEAKRPVRFPVSVGSVQR